ncbi:MAG: rhodanese-like domain-containing protein [Dehalococcoidia bacterium]|nr:rhodanese-like domain-containing protein [Dehalococcoidia bacterium]
MYCRSGNRSAAASQVMVNLGFKYISNMTGGYM